jgi:NTP pyrophosphatase (non-canonical NTP hydrolase)
VGQEESVTQDIQKLAEEVLWLAEACQDDKNSDMGQMRAELNYEECALEAAPALARAVREMATTRDIRQARVAEWCTEAFGAEHTTSIPQRGIRMLEEAIELAQACGCDPAMAHKLVDFVYSRPPGTIGQELGGVGTTVLALANAAGLSADAEEAREVTRVLSKPREHFTQRNQAKNAAGFDALAYPTGSLPTPPGDSHGE